VQRKREASSVQQAGRQPRQQQFVLLPLEESAGGDWCIYVHLLRVLVHRILPALCRCRCKCSVQCAVCSVQCTGCSVQCAVCSVQQSAVCSSVQCAAVCSVQQCAVCRCVGADKLTKIVVFDGNPCVCVDRVGHAHPSEPCPYVRHDLPHCWPPTSRHLGVPGVVCVCCKHRGESESNLVQDERGGSRMVSLTRHASRVVLDGRMCFIRSTEEKRYAAKSSSHNHVRFSLIQKQTKTLVDAWQ
jgi:hypothetical protein